MSQTNATDAKDPTPAGPRLCIAYPVIFTTDMATSLAFYETKLGFAVDFLYGEPPFYGMVSRDGAGLHLRHVDRHPMSHDEADLLAASIPVAGEKDLFLELKEKGVTFHQTFKSQPWGASDFIVKDPDGNLLHFSGEPG